MTVPPAPFAVPDAEDLALLAYLSVTPDQRIVHQPGYPIDVNGYQVCAESAFFRQLPTPFGIKLPGGLVTFRRLWRNGWIEADAVYAGQVECKLHHRLVELFEQDETWRRVDARLRMALRRPPRLNVVRDAE